MQKATYQTDIPQKEEEEDENRLNILKCTEKSSSFDGCFTDTAAISRSVSCGAIIDWMIVASRVLDGIWPRCQGLARRWQLRHGCGHGLRVIFRLERVFVHHFFVVQRQLVIR